MRRLYLHEGEVLSGLLSSQDHFLDVYSTFFRTVLPAHARRRTNVSSNERVAACVVLRCSVDAHICLCTPGGLSNVFSSQHELICFRLYFIDNVGFGFCCCVVFLVSCSIVFIWRMYVCAVGHSRHVVPGVSLCVCDGCLIQGNYISLSFF